MVDLITEPKPSTRNDLSKAQTQGDGTAIVCGDVAERLPTDVQLEDNILRLIDLIQQTGRPEQWAAFGGDIASISELHGRLIIRAPIDYHMQIWRLLVALRQSRPNVR